MDTTDDQTIPAEEQQLKKRRGRPRKPTPPPKPPKEKKPSLYKENRAEWFKQYYRTKIFKECVCETCGVKFSSEASRIRHEGRNKTCLIIKLRAELGAEKRPLDAGLVLSDDPSS